MISYIPANVLGASVEAVGPVCEGLSGGVEVTERVHEPISQEGSEPVSLLLSEACCLGVGLRVLQICNHKQNYPSLFSLSLFSPLSLRFFSRKGVINSL